MKFVRFVEHFIDERDVELNEIMGTKEEYEGYEGWVCIPFIIEDVFIESYFNEDGVIDESKSRIRFSPETSKILVNYNYVELIAKLLEFENSQEHILELINKSNNENSGAI